MQTQSNTTENKDKKTRGETQKSKMDKDDFFKKVRGLGYSNKELSNILGISVHTVNNWGTKPIPLIVERMITLLEISKTSKDFLEKCYLKDNATTKPKRLRGTKI